MTDEVKLMPAHPGDPMFDMCMVAIDLMRASTADLVMQADDPRDGLTIVMTAASMFSGVMAGTLMAMGALTKQDQRRTVEASSHNFREGLKIGLKKGLKIGQEMSGTGMQ